MATTRLTSYADLLEYLKENNVPYQADPAALAVEVPVTMPPLKGVVYIRWEKALPYVQIIHPFVMNVPEGRVPAVETAIIRANNIIPLPGLGFHHDRRFVYMRLCVPMYKDGMLAANFQNQVLSVLNNAREFLQAFKAIVAGKPGEEIMALAVHDAEMKPRA
jgi:hypothetical protein